VFLAHYSSDKGLDSEGESVGEEAEKLHHWTIFREHFVVVVTHFVVVVTNFVVVVVNFVVVVVTNFVVCICYEVLEEICVLVLIHSNL